VLVGMRFEFLQPALQLKDRFFKIERMGIHVNRES
jgi:hypothetical protein